MIREGIREIVLNERRYELAYEGHRWFDLIRTGKVFEAVKNRGNDIGEDESPLSNYIQKRWYGRFTSMNYAEAN